jgi:hypothetical protein
MRYRTCVKPLAISGTREMSGKFSTARQAVSNSDWRSAFRGETDFSKGIRNPNVLSQESIAYGSTAGPTALPD